jgi:hypothetical protein
MTRLVTRLAALTAVVLFAASSTAYSQGIKTVVSPDGKTATAENSRGVATTRITPNANGFTAVTTYQAKPSYQPMGGNGYRPMGDSYKPMGNR